MDRFNKFFASLGASVVAIVALLGGGDVTAQTNEIVAMISMFAAPFIVYFVPNVGDYLDTVEEFVRRLGVKADEIVIKADAAVAEVTEKAEEALNIAESITDELGSISSKK